MKTEMTIKTGLGTKAEINGYAAKRERIKEGNLFSGCRMCACVLLLALLAAGGYIGAQETPQKMAAAPLFTSVQVMNEKDYREKRFDEVLEEQRKARQAEIALLDSVVEKETVDEAVKNSALEQKIEIVRRMETESAVRTGLAGMGYAQAAVICGAGQVYLIFPEGEVDSQEDTLRILDAVSAFAQVQAQNVKIILVKK